MLPTAVDKAIETLRRGGVVVYPTDTIPGIGCRADSVAAIGRIYRLKQREDSKALIVLVSSPGMLRRYVTVSEPVERAMAEADRPLTVVYNRCRRLPVELQAEDGSIAIRLTHDPVCVALIDALGVPLVSTSANISGEPAPQWIADVDPTIIDGVDFVLPEQENHGARQASRIIRANADGTISVLRP